MSLEPLICEGTQVRCAFVLCVTLSAGCAAPEPAPTTTGRTHLGAVLDNGDNVVLADQGGRSDDDRKQALMFVAAAAKQRESGALADAEKSAERALELDASSPEAHVEWALAAEGLARDPSLIAAHYQLATRLAPEDGRAQLLAAAWAARSGDAERALDGYARAVAADPTLVEAYARRADLLAARGDLAAAVVEYQRALGVDGKYVPALIGLADTAERSKQMDVSEKAHRTLIELFPTATLYRSRIIAFYNRTGQPGRAATEEKALNKLEPKDKRRLRNLKKR